MLVLERIAHPGATVSCPPALLVQRARAAFSPDTLEFLRVLALLGRRFPRRGRARPPRLSAKGSPNSARADLVTSLDGLYSGQPVTIPPEITAVLIQWAANALETEAPYVAPNQGDPAFVAYAATESHVIKQGDRFLRLSARHRIRRRRPGRLPGLEQDVSSGNGAAERLGNPDTFPRAGNEMPWDQDNEGEADAASELTLKGDLKV